MTHIVGKLDGFLRKVADQREEMGNSAVAGSHTKLQQRIVDARTSLSEQGQVSEVSL